MQQKMASRRDLCQRAVRGIDEIGETTVLVTVIRHVEKPTSRIGHNRPRGMLAVAGGRPLRRPAPDVWLIVNRLTSFVVAFTTWANRPEGSTVTARGPVPSPVETGSRTAVRYPGPGSDREADTLSLPWFTTYR